MRLNCHQRHRVCFVVCAVCFLRVFSLPSPLHFFPSSFFLFSLASPPCFLRTSPSGTEEEVQPFRGQIKQNQSFQETKLPAPAELQLDAPAACPDAFLLLLQASWPTQQSQGRLCDGKDFDCITRSLLRVAKATALRGRFRFVRLQSSCRRLLQEASFIAPTHRAHLPVGFSRVAPPGTLPVQGSMVSLATLPTPASPCL